MRITVTLRRAPKARLEGRRPVPRRLRACRDWRCILAGSGTAAGVASIHREGRRMFRILGIAVFLGLQTCAAAAASCGLGFMGVIFFEHVPQNIDALSILEITIVDLTNPDKRPFFVGTARIDKVINGKVPDANVDIFVPDEPCLVGFPVGTQGTVIGTIVPHSTGRSDFLAITEKDWRVRH
jgi:hypothetical protein